MSSRLIFGYVALGIAFALVVAAVLALSSGLPTSVPPAETGGDETLSHEQVFGRLMLAIAAVLLVARGLGAIVRQLGQPQVMGEVLGGILLGPSLVGALVPDLQRYLFPPEVVPLLSGAADIGLAFYMFLVGVELDLNTLRGRLGQAVFISNTSVLAPMAIGMSVALLIYPAFGQGGFLAFALFMGVAMSVTAFPVLARILLERRMLRRPVGAISIASAAVDDATAWSLLALATATATAASLTGALVVLALGGVLSALILLPGRRLLSRVATAYDEAGHIPSGWMNIIFLAVLLAAFSAAQVGIAAIFGAFLVGLAMPRRSDLGQALAERIEPFVVAVLLPLFFVVTGLKTDLGLLTGDVALMTVLLLGAAILGKFGGGMAAARFVGFGSRESAAIGILLNTRGLTELIVLNIGRDLGVLSPELFTSLVVVALITTLMTGPALRLIDRQGALSEPPEERLPAAVPSVVQAPVVLVAVLDLKNLDAMVSLAARLVQGPGAEMIVVHALVPRRVSAGIQRDDSALRDAETRLADVQRQLSAAGLQVRVTAFATGAPARDLLALAERQKASLVVVDGQRTVIGAGITGRGVAELLEHSSADVAVLVHGAEAPEPDTEHTIVVPFGGADHDWAAAEVASSIAWSSGATLRFVGVSTDTGSGQVGAERLLAEAALLAQRFAGVRTETRLVRPSRMAILEAASDAGLLVVGLSPRWRREGLGPARSGLVRHSPAPILFIRTARLGPAAGPVAPWSQISGGSTRWSLPPAGSVGPAESGQGPDDLETPGNAVDRL